MRCNAPIGVFDSGVGGLSILNEIHQQMPRESLLFLADTAYVPYGEKEPQLIRERCRHIAAILLEQGAKAIVAACNTATVAAIADLRERYPLLPIIGMEPAVKPASQATRNGIVGVLATNGTLKSARFAALLDRFATDVQVITQPCPGLVERVEAGDLQGRETRALLQRYLAPLLEAGCDTIILGCTHYPFLKPLLEALVPGDTMLIDTGSAVVRRLHGLLQERGLLATKNTAAAAHFWTSGDRDVFRHQLTKLWQGFAPEDVISFFSESSINERDFLLPR